MLLTSIIGSRTFALDLFNFYAKLQLNATYVYYGASGEYRKNSSWDLVDVAKDDEKVIAEAKSDDLPEEMRTMNVEQRKVYISKNRKSVQKSRPIYNP